MSEPKTKRLRPPSPVRRNGIASPEIASRMRARVDSAGSVERLTHDPAAGCPVSTTTVLRVLAGLPVRESARLALAPWLGVPAATPAEPAASAA